MLKNDEKLSKLKGKNINTDFFKFILTWQQKLVYLMGMSLKS